MNYERCCISCEWATDFSLERVADVEKPCPMCGQPSIRFMSRAPFMTRDTFSVPMVDTVMAQKPLVFQTRTEHRKAMEARGLRLMDQHVPIPGTDKSDHSAKWQSGSRPVESDAERAYRLLHDEHFQTARRGAIEAYRERQNVQHDQHDGRHASHAADDPALAG